MILSLEFKLKVKKFLHNKEQLKPLHVFPSPENPELHLQVNAPSLPFCEHFALTLSHSLPSFVHVASAEKKG